MKRKIVSKACTAGMLGVFCIAGGQSLVIQAAEILPEILSEQSFIYDELETGEGSSLYTLRFTDSGYKLYQDNGIGLIAKGSVSVGKDRSLSFETEDAVFEGNYIGSAFQEPSVTLEYEGKTMDFKPDTESGEYVYLSYLGVMEGEIQGEQAVLILERWFEFYLYTDGTLKRGTYEIYEDGRICLTTLDGQELTGQVISGGSDTEKEFDRNEVVISFEMDQAVLAEPNNSDSTQQETVTFTYADGTEAYTAEHAMGEYTLSLYEPDVFLIHGVDGLVKAMGTIQMTDNGGEAVYFPRSITNEAELDERFAISFICEEESIIFPDTTCLLPRSGNIDEDTGYGSYWTAGTKLEFIKETQVPANYTITYETQVVDGEMAPLVDALSQENGILRQSMPSLGTAKPLVVLIDFPDQHRPRFITAEGIEEAIFDVNNPESLSAYYFRSSYGKLTIDGTVLDWYRMEKERNRYDSDKEIMKEVLDYFINEKGLKLSDYDADQDGCVDSLYVLWAGNMGDSDGSWSSAYRSTWNNSPQDWGTKVSGYIFVPGTTVWSSVPLLVCNVNSLTHETGHLLGLNDYYSYDTGDRADDELAYTGGALEGGIGGMDMMDANIAEHNVFSKWVLGWLKPEVVEYEEISSLESEELTYVLHPSNEQGEALFIKLKSSDSMFTELLVVEVISTTMNASELTRLKEPVVRILHVDASLNEENLEGNWRAYGFKNDNSYTSTKFISLLEADGKDEVLNFIPGISGNKISYDPEDYFTAGDVISADTYPSTNGYDSYGNASIINGLKITVESISESGEAVIRLGYETPKETLEIMEVSPGPLVVPYEEGMRTTIPAETREITVTFSEEITEAKSGSLEQIQLLSGNQLVEGWNCRIDGNVLKVILTDSAAADEKNSGADASGLLMPNKDYTLVIPAGIVKSTKNPELRNNCSSIFGFVTEIIN